MILQRVLRMLVFLIVLSVIPFTAQSQMTRESGVSTIAGSLQKTVDDFDDYLVEARGEQVLVVDLDAGAFINKSSHSGEEPGHDSVTTSVAADETSHEEGGCGGPGGFTLEVLNADLDVVCTAEKPKSPGWEADPRMACLLSERGDYILRVRFATLGGHDEPQGSPKVHPYLLNVSLRELAPDGPYVSLDEAIKQSRNQLKD